MSVAIALWLLALTFYGALALAMGVVMRDWEFARPWFALCMTTSTIMCVVIGAVVWMSQQ